MKIEKIKSSQDDLELEFVISKPKNKPIGIVQILHGMNQHKEQYFDFIEELSKNGYVVIMHDQRGHGNSIKEKNDLGYFYSENINFLIEDAYQITKYIKNEYPNLPITLFGHSMGTIVGRNYIKKYDSKINKAIFTGPPSKNVLIDFAIFMSYLCRPFFKEKQGNKFINDLAIKKFNNKYDKPMGWISDDEKLVSSYIKDTKVKFFFTTNAFIVMFKLLKEAYKSWTPNNKNLEIFLMSGSDDQTIISEKKFEETVNFLSSLGYVSVKSKIYKDKRHDLIHSKSNDEIMQDIIKFLEN